MVLFSDTIGGLQSVLGTLASYSDKLSLTFNVKTVIFSKVSQLNVPEQLNHKIEVFEIVNQFNYLLTSIVNIILLKNS